MFPIHVATKGVELPKKGTYYLITKSGFYIHKDTGLIKALVEVDEIPFICDVEPYCEMLLPKLPADIIARAKTFFEAVFNKHRSESAVVLHYNPKIQDYYLHCPEQQVSYGGVHYDLDDRFEDYQLVGTIHSHCDFNAFHSGTDIGDEEHQDGLHITLGHVNQQSFSASGCLVVNGSRFEVALENAALGVRPVTMQAGIKNPNINLHQQNHYRISLSDEEIAILEANYGDEIKEWVKTQVKAQAGFFGGGRGFGGGWREKKDNVYTLDRTDGKWKNHKGEEQGQGGTSVLGGGPSQYEEVDESEETWDAEAVLKDFDLFPNDDDLGRLPEGEVDDLTDLTVVGEEDELDDGITGITHSSEVEPTDEELKQQELEDQADQLLEQDKEEDGNDPTTI
jgi:PRTRC genetic system protein A